MVADTGGGVIVLMEKLRYLRIPIFFDWLIQAFAKICSLSVPIIVVFVDVRKQCCKCVHKVIDCAVDAELNSQWGYIRKNISDDN